ncbi:MAG: glycine cleavage system protein GcvH [Deltaproteobacteria bacterium]|nr:glycine cleavage system protein GcvH [Deltaproteobacteria bacterium]MBW2256187.1 glycine cleavage system protein GcvH [Deltaproteobacteria bacterium]
MNVPSQLKYTDHDEWILVEDNIITIGITDFAQDALGELVHVELPSVGEQITGGNVLCEVESVKAVAEVYAPADGEVVAVNEALDGGEETVNDDPYGDGWLVRMRVDDLSQLNDLLDGAAYEAKVEAS